MTTYTIITRVELHKDTARTKPHSSDAAEYDLLHEEMHKLGYRRCFTGGDDKLRKLPPGEYRIRETADSGDAARTAAMDKAKKAATKATSAERFSLLVNGDGTFSTYHLELITEDPDA